MCYSYSTLDEAVTALKEASEYTGVHQYVSRMNYGVSDIEKLMEASDRMTKPRQWLSGFMIEGFNVNQSEILNPSIEALVRMPVSLWEHEVVKALPLSLYAYFYQRLGHWHHEKWRKDLLVVLRNAVSKEDLSFVRSFFGRQASASKAYKKKLAKLAVLAEKLKKSNATAGNQAAIAGGAEYSW